MSWREVFKKVIVEFFERRVPSLVERELVVKPFDLVCIIGPRRAGKTYYFYQVIRELMDSGCRCLYVDFEYEFLRGVKAVDLVELFNAYRELYGVDPEYVFLDEIHVVSGWEYFVRRIRDTGLYRVYITGSSSKLLAREVATQLRGRAASYILLPFSFREYLKAIGFSIDYSVLEYSDRVKSKLLYYLRDYMSYGGFPELVLKRSLYNELLYSISEGVFYRDIVDRYGVRKVYLLEIVLKHLARCVGKQFTITRLYNIVKGLGFKVSKSTILEYTRMFSEALLFFYVNQIVTPFYESIKRPRKVYIVDNSLLKAYGVNGEPSILMENLVFLELLRLKNIDPFIEIGYWRDNTGLEVDFVVKKGDRVLELIQSTYMLTIDNRKREVQALLKASRKLECSRLSIITWDQEELIRTGNRVIQVKSLWKWLLERHYTVSRPRSL